MCIDELEDWRKSQPVKSKAEMEKQASLFIEINFEYDKSGRGYICREKGKLHTVQQVAAKFAAHHAAQVREQSIAETNHREIDAIREGHKAEICGRCEVVMLAHKHFIRCENSPCPMKDGKLSVLDQLCPAPPSTSQGQGE